MGFWHDFVDGYASAGRQWRVLATYPRNVVVGLATALRLIEETWIPILPFMANFTWICLFLDDCIGAAKSLEAHFTFLHTKFFPSQCYPISLILFRNIFLLSYTLATVSFIPENCVRPPGAVLKEEPHKLVVVSILYESFNLDSTLNLQIGVMCYCQVQREI